MGEYGRSDRDKFLHGVDRHKRSLRKRGMSGEAAQVDADLRAAAKKQRAARAASMRPDKIGKAKPRTTTTKRTYGPTYVKSSYLSKNWNPLSDK